MAYTKADKDGLVPLNRDNNLPASPSVPSFPLDQINVVQLAQELSSMLNKPSPKTWIGQFFLSKKLEFEQSKVAQLASYVEQVRAINGSITNMQAELFLQPTVLQRIIDGDAAGAQRLVELQIAEHKNAVAKHEDEMKARKLQLDAAELANLKTKAEINLMEAQTRAEKAWAALIKSTVDNINFKNMPPALQYSVIQAIATKGTASTNPVLEEEINKFFKQQREAEAGKAMHEMRKEGADADMKEMDVERNRLAMEELKKKKGK